MDTNNRNGHRKITEAMIERQAHVKREIAHLLKQVGEHFACGDIEGAKQKSRTLNTYRVERAKTELHIAQAIEETAEMFHAAYYGKLPAVESEPDCSVSA